MSFEGIISLKGGKTLMKKRIVCLVLALCTLLSLCACSSGGKYKSVKTLGQQQYSIGFRNGDSTYHYIDRALRTLSYEGKIDEISRKWFGSDSAVSFPSKKDALDDLGYIAERTFIIGVDLDSAPLAFQNGEEYVGFDIDLAQAVCERLGWALKIQPIHSEDAYVELNSGNIDCAWGGVALDTQSEKYTILVTYMSTDIVLAGKGTDSSSLRDKILYIGTTQSALDIMNENTSASRKLGQITRVNGGAADYFAALDSGKCDLILTTDAAVDYFNTH